MRTRIFLMAVILALFGCGGGDSSGESGSVLSGIGEVMASLPDFAPELGVELAAMERSPTGLYTRVLEEGGGEPAAGGDAIAVHYTGWLSDGTRFDSSEGNEPLPVIVGETPLIDGFTEGVRGIRSGESRLLVIPPELGYGAAGAGRDISGGATLVFRVHRVDGAAP